MNGTKCRELCRQSTLPLEEGFPTSLIEGKKANHISKVVRNEQDNGATDFSVNAYTPSEEASTSASTSIGSEKKKKLSQLKASAKLFWKPEVVEALIIEWENYPLLFQASHYHERPCVGSTDIPPRPSTSAP